MNDDDEKDIDFRYWFLAMILGGASWYWIYWIIFEM